MYVGGVCPDKKWEFSLYLDTGCEVLWLFCHCVHIVVSERASCWLLPLARAENHGNSVFAQVRTWYT